MKRKAFSFIEIIVSLSLLLFLLLPTLKINTQQAILFRKIDKVVDEFDFFSAIHTYLKDDNIFFTTNKNFNFKNYKELKDNYIFKDFNFSNFPKETFNLEITVICTIIDFYSSKSKANIIEIKLSSKNKQIKTKIIKFKN